MTEEEDKKKAEEEEAKKKAEEEAKKKEEEDSNNSSPLIDATNEASGRMEKATAASNAAAKRLEKVSSDLTLQGKGLMTKQEPPEKDPKAYGKSIMDGILPESKNESK